MSLSLGEVAASRTLDVINRKVKRSILPIRKAPTLRSAKTGTESHAGVIIAGRSLRSWIRRTQRPVSYREPTSMVATPRQRSNNAFPPEQASLPFKGRTEKKNCDFARKRALHF